MKKRIVPPNMNEHLLIFGMTIPELIIVIVAVFIFVKQLTLHHPLFFLLPSAAVVLFARALDNQDNCLHILLREFRYYTGQQSFSLRGEEIVYKQNKNAGKC